jgi:hypothetical protein
MGKPINDQHGSPNSTVAQNGEHSTQSNIKASPHFVFQNGEFCSPVLTSLFGQSIEYEHNFCLPFAGHH